MTQYWMAIEWAILFGWVGYTASVLADDLAHYYARNHPPYTSSHTPRDFYNIGNFVGIWGLTVFLSAVEGAFRTQSRYDQRVWEAWVWLDQWLLFRSFGRIALWLTIALGAGLILGGLTILFRRPSPRGPGRVVPVPQGLRRGGKSA